MNRVVLNLSMDQARELDRAFDFIGWNNSSFPGIAKLKARIQKTIAKHEGGKNETEC